MPNLVYVSMFVPSCRPSAVYERELRGTIGDAKSTAAELSQISFRQSLGCGDAHIVHKESSSLAYESLLSPAGCDGWLPDSTSHPEWLEVDRICRSDKGWIYDNSDAALSQLTLFIIGVLSSSDGVFWLLTTSAANDGTEDRTTGFRTHPEHTEFTIQKKTRHSKRSTKFKILLLKMHQKTTKINQPLLKTDRS